MTIYVIDLESVPSRYTCEWKQHVPQQIKKHTKQDVVVISGGETPQATTPGAFLNFGGTNVYKSKQLEIIGEMFCKGQVKDGDYFLYTDAWNPTVIQLRYMAELLGINIRIGGLWHAGSYDPHDFLGRLIGDAPWARLAEKSMYHTYDDNFFATDFHIEMFVRTLFGPDNPWEEEEVTEALSGEIPKIKRVGWPMEYLYDSLVPYQKMAKRDLILFPHRIAPEKQVDIFRDLAEQLPQYEFVVCQERSLTKNEYHNLLGEAKMIFSANLQETLGISWYEGALVDAIPFVPDRLSYSEMALDEFKYPSQWTSSFSNYKRHKTEIVDKIVDLMENYSSYLVLIDQQRKKLRGNFFSGDNIYQQITSTTGNKA
jgi:glycosyltransferase involved in cell wall biosynthesis